MYGNGAGPIVGVGGGVLGATGSGDVVFPLIVAVIVFGVGTLLVVRSRMMRRAEASDD